MSTAYRPRTLILLRHGKSAYPAGVGDHERPLAARGEREAALAGAWIGQHLPQVDRIVSSTAQRTRQTAAASGVRAPLTLIDDIYEAYPDELLDVVKAFEPAEHTVLLVGHAPGLPGLAEDLAGPGSDPSALSRLRSKYPTSAVAVLSVDGDWADVGRDGATQLNDFVVPRS